ncbi:hypothetical protein QEN19_004209 [Hanseniaspora menglaensis]
MVEQINKKRTFTDVEKETSTNPLYKTDNTKELTKSSLLRDDDNSFPRGGASALTPLELKQVANEAASDVLFANTKDTENLVSSKSNENKKLKKNKFSNNFNLEDEATAEDGELDMREKFQHLSYKIIPTNSILLGMISKVTKMGLSFDFEDGIFGYCPIENISSTIFSSGGKITSDVEEDSEIESEEEEEDSVDLEQMFKIGDFYRCKVSKNHILQNNSKKGNKKLTVTIDPAQVNSGMDDTDILQKGAALQLTIKTVEDHGCVMDAGLENTQLSIFMPSKELTEDEMKIGNVFLATVSKVSDRVVTVTTIAKNSLKTIESIDSPDSVIPGSYVNFLIDSIKPKAGVFGKVFGSIPAILNFSHINSKDLDEFNVGQTIPVRIVSKIDFKNFLFLHVSQLDNIINLDSTLTTKTSETFSIGFKFDESLNIISKDSSYIYVQLNENIKGVIHHSKVDGELTKNKIQPTRIISYNKFNNLFVLTNLKDQIDNEYLTIKDIPIGTLLTGEIREVDGSKGVTMKLMNNFIGKVLIKDLSDVKLNYPERKFKIGSKAKGRVLSINLKNGQVMMTFRKQLINGFELDNIKMLSSFENVTVGTQTLATVDSFNNYGVTIKFFNNLRGFIPKAEVSDSFVKDASKFLKENQIVQVKILQVDESKNRIIASCKLHSKEEFSELNDVIDSLVLGRSVEEFVIVEKTKDSIVVELTQNRSIRGIVYIGHLSDQRIEQNRALIKKLSIGDVVKALVIDKDNKTKVINLSMKESLIKTASDETLPTSFEDVVEKTESSPMYGYIKSISSRGVFVAFNGKFVGLVLPSYTGLSREEDLNSKFYQEQSVKVYLLRTDPENQRFLLSFIPPAVSVSSKNAITEVVNPVDVAIKSVQDLTSGKKIKVLIKSVKKTQINVVISDNIHGRIDLSQVFKSLDEVKPLYTLFSKDDVIEASIVGVHEIKAAQFLPISNKFDKNSLIELSLINENIQSVNDFEEGQKVLGYVNNISDNKIWISVNPSVKGKVIKFSSSLNVGDFAEFEISKVDKVHNNLLLSSVVSELDISKLVVGETVETNVIKVFPSYVLLNIKNTSQQAISYITDALPEFTNNDLAKYYTTGQSLKATIKTVDVENKKVKVSLLSTTQKSFDELKVNEKIPALVKKVTTKGIFLHISDDLDAFVPVSKISDSYLKDWQRQFSPLQTKICKIVSCESQSTILATLRESEINGELKITKSFDDVEVGGIYDGVVRNVTEFGVFVKISGVENVVGLAHKKEISDDAQALEGKELTDLFGEGDLVRCYVIKKNAAKKQVSLSLKGSKFKQEEDDEEDVVMDDEDEEDVMDVDFDNDSDSDSEDEVAFKPTELSEDGLSLSAGFDWTGKILDQVNQDDDSDSDSEDEDFTKKVSSSKAQKPVDKTIALSTETPQSNADFERLILSDPNSAVNWLNYTAFQLTVGEITKAKEILERALNTINYREEQEKLNIWVAKLNLEFTFGDSSSLQETFTKACSYMDDYVIHSKMIMIYTLANKIDEADKLYGKALKKFGSERLSIWEKYGEFLLSNSKNDEAHLILAKGLKQLPKRDHVTLVKKFAQLEYKYGDIEQGRSLMEGLIVDAPKKIDLWNIYLDLEIKLKEKKRVEDLFERCLSNSKLNKKQAKYFFKKWVEFEETVKDNKMIDYVAAKASEYIRNNQ